MWSCKNVKHEKVISSKPTWTTVHIRHVYVELPSQEPFHPGACEQPWLAKLFEGLQPDCPSLTHCNFKESVTANQVFTMKIGETPHAKHCAKHDFLRQWTRRAASSGVCPSRSVPKGKLLQLLAHGSCHKLREMTEHTKATKKGDRAQIGFLLARDYVGTLSRYVVK